MAQQLLQRLQAAGGSYEHPNYVRLFTPQGFMDADGKCVVLKRPLSPAEQAALVGLDSGAKPTCQDDMFATASNSKICFGKAPAATVPTIDDPHFTK